MLSRGFVCALVAMVGTAVPADPPTGTREIALLGNDGTRIVIGDVTFGDGGGYRIDWADPRFSDHFLSMRPFRCIEGPDKHWCHVPYPYAIDRSVTGDDLTDLEYDLVFIWKGATEYGINMWNGVYYRLTQDGEQITGTLHEMDMDVLSAPPDAGEMRPIRAQDIHEADADSHWLPRLVIK